MVLTSECLHVNIYTNKSIQNVHEVPNISGTLRQVDQTTQHDVIKKLISCKAGEQVGF